MSENFINILPSLILGGFALLATIWFSRAAGKREHHKILKELFTEFNTRYSKLNEKLYFFVENNKNSEVLINKKDVATRDDVIDYFNLCAEQYFWYKRGRLDENLWMSWNTGMNYWYKQECIKKLWKEEIKNKDGKLSYYITNGDEFFKN
jgi:hypothetical protein